MSSRRSLLLVLLAFFSLTLFQVAVPLQATALGASPSSVGLILVLTGVVGLALDAPLAQLSDQIGRRAVVTLGGAVLVTASILMTWTASLAPLAVATILFGIAHSAQSTSMLASLSEGSPIGRSADVQGWNASLQRMGALAAAALILVVGSPRMLFAAIGFAAVCSVGVSAIRTGRRQATRRPGIGVGMLGSYRSSARLLLSGGDIEVSMLANLMLTLLFMSTNSVLVLEVDSEAGAAMTTIFFGLLLATRDATSVIVSPLFGRLSRRFGWGACLVLSMFIGCIGMLLCGVLEANSRVLYLALAAVGASVGFGVAGTNHAVTLSTRSSERALGLVASAYAGRVGSLVLPVLLFGLYDYGGRPTRAPEPGHQPTRDSGRRRPPTSPAAYGRVSPQRCPLCSVESLPEELRFSRHTRAFSFYGTLTRPSSSVDPG